MSTKQTHRLLDPAAIVPSPTNPRKHFDPAKLAELTESVKMRGVLQPILVRKHHGIENRFEIVCGERRWRAATAAKIGEMPVMICDLDDEAVLEVQVIENLQRDDLHPLEEAEGYDALMKMHGHTAADIAAKVGKDKSYVNKRMKLLALIPKARETFYANKITPSIALLLARLPDEKAQAEGLKYSQQEDYQGNLPTAADVSHFLKQKFMHGLKSAPFEIHDHELTSAGACSACPKRTTNQTDLFGEDMKGDDRCLDGACYKKKVETWEGLQLAKAKQSGQTVLKGAEAEAVHNYNSKYLRVDQGCDEDPKRRTWKQVLAPAIKHGQIKTALAQTRNGLIAVVSRSEALKHSGLAVAQKMSKAHDEGKAQSKAARVEADRKDFIRSAKVDAVLGRISAAAENGDMGEFEWRILAGCVVDMGGFYVSEDVARRRKLKTKGERPTDTMERVVKELDHAQLVCLVFEMLALRHDDPLNDMAKRHGIDLKEVERQAREEFAREKDLAGVRSEAAQPARVGKQTKAVTPDAGGKDAPVAKGRAPVFAGVMKGVSVGKLAPGVLPKAKKEKQDAAWKEKHGV